MLVFEMLTGRFPFDKSTPDDGDAGRESAQCTAEATEPARNPYARGIVRGFEGGPSEYEHGPAGALLR